MEGLLPLRYCQAVNNKQERHNAPFMKADIPSLKKRFSVVRTAAWLSPAAMYSPFGPCGRQGHRICAEALGRLRPLYGICLMAACQHLQCHSVVTGFRLWRFHDTTRMTTDRECLGYICNPHSLMEGMEMLCNHATTSNHR